MMFMPMFSPVRKAVDGVTMVAGYVPDFGGHTGYSNGGSFPGVMGSITGEPIMGQSLQYIMNNSDGTEFTIGFEGDIVSLLEPMTLYINSEPYIMSSADDYSYEPSLNYTTFIWYDPSIFDFIEGLSYHIRIA